MKWLIILIVLSSCTLNANQSTKEQEKDLEFNKLIENVNKNHSTFRIADDEASDKQNKLVQKTIGKIVTLNNEVKGLKNEINLMTYKTDTVFIHDTVRVTEKKSFWGKNKIDTL